MTETSKKGAVAARKPPPNAGKGRPKGTRNKATVALKEAILKAAEASGSDGKGKGGLTGYLTQLSKTEPKAFSSLLGRVLPLDVRASGPNGEPLPTSTVMPVINVTVRSDK